MALLVPDTSYDPLAAHQGEPKMSDHDIICAHTMAGNFKVVDRMFHENGFGGTESHLGMDHNGFTKQWQDLMYQADANYEGNPRVISIETEDVAPVFPQWVNNGGPVPKWTKSQVAKLIQITTAMCRVEFHKNCPSSWECHKVGIPARLIDNTASGQRGLAYHRQGIDGNYPGPYKGRRGVGEEWSTGSGKLCPGDARITQWVTVVIPGVARALGEDQDMTPTQARTLTTIENRSEAMYKALRNDEDADKALVRGIRDHMRTVIDEQFNEHGGAVRTALGDKAFDGAMKALTDHNTPEVPIP